MASNMKNGYGDYEGTIIEIGPKQEIGTKGFVKREIIVEFDTEAAYRNPIKFTFKKDAADLLTGYRKGQRVKIGYVIDGRRWDGPRGTQYFVDLVGLKIAAVGATDVPAPAEPEPDMSADPEDLPF